MMLDPSDQTLIAHPGVSLETRKRQSRAQLTRKQLKFIAEFCHLENDTEAAAVPDTRARTTCSASKLTTT